MAHFITELTKFDPIGQCGIGVGGDSLYCVKTNVINKLKALADNGDIERYIVFT